MVDCRCVFALLSQNNAVDLDQMLSINDPLIDVKRYWLSTH